MLRRRFIVFGITFAITLSAAQAGKFFFPHIICNTGIGLGIGGGIWPIVLEIIFISATGFFVIREFHTKTFFRCAYLSPLGGGFLLGGATSNLLDRFTHGCVIDYFQPFHWLPAFNIADTAISVGIALLLIHLFCTNSHRECRP